MPEPVDPLLLGQRVVAILETGLRTATYKLATLPTQPRVRILIATNKFRAETGGSAWLDVEMLRAPTAYRAAIDEIALCLAQQPLHRLQRMPGASDPFLYDDSFLVWTMRGFANPISHPTSFG